MFIENSQSSANSATFLNLAKVVNHIYIENERVTVSVK